jgi:hypothetical protein
LEGGTAFNGAGDQEAADTVGGIVRADGLEIGVHDAVGRRLRGEPGEAEGVEIDGGVRDLALGKKVGGLAEDG